jgi:transposase
MVGEVVMGRALKISWQDNEARLFQEYRAEKQPGLKPRPYTLWRLRQGDSLAGTARVLGVHYTSVQQWVVWYRQGGVAVVQDHRKMGQGQPPRHTPEQREELRFQVAQGRFRTARGAVQWVKETFGWSTGLRGCTRS